MLPVGEEQESRIETKIEKKKWKKEKKNIYKDKVFLFEMQNKLKGFELGYFESTQEINSATNLSR